MPHMKEDFSETIKALEEQIDRDQAEIDNSPLPFIRAANASSAPAHYRTAASYRSECEGICSVLDELVAEAQAHADSQDGILSREELSEYESKFRALTNILGIYELRMRASLQFEAIENTDDRPRN